MLSETLESYVARVVERTIAGRYSERHGLVTSYDPKKYLAKVTFQPSGQESGWLPIETGHIGDGYGMAVGLTPGDGKKTGDQVIVRFQENDFEGGKIVQRVHSDQDKPPEVQAGEMVMWTKWGQKIYFKNDGSVTLTDGKGATLFFDGKGNITNTGNKIDTNATQDDHTITSPKNISEKAGKTIQMNASDAINLGNPDVQANSEVGPSMLVNVQIPRGQ